MPIGAFTSTRVCNCSGESRSASATIRSPSAWNFVTACCQVFVRQKAGKSR